MSHIVKIHFMIVLQRIRRKLLPEISEAQYGSIKDRDIRNTVFNIRILSERSIEHQQDIYVVFIDYKKAFDKVRHGDHSHLLEEIQVTTSISVLFATSTSTKGQQHDSPIERQRDQNRKKSAARVHCISRSVNLYGE